MATMTLNLVVGANTYTKTVTLSNADAARLQTAFGKPPPGVPDGNSGLPANATPDQIFQLLATGVFQTIKARILAYEQSIIIPPSVVDLPMT